MPRIKHSHIPSWREVTKIWRYTLRRYRQGKLPLRNLVLIGLLIATGARISEILALRKKDVNLHEATVTITQLKKRRKKKPQGEGKEKRAREEEGEGEAEKQPPKREIVLPPWLLPWLERYLRGLGWDEKLFPITRRQAYNIVLALSEQAIGVKVRPHAFRHAVGIRILTVSKDLDLTRRVLGHSDYKTVKSYLDYTLRDRRREIEEAMSLEE